MTFVRRRFQAWLQARLRPTDTLVLTQRNVYILPTRPGFMLAATLLVLLVASINYQLNLGYLLTFLLAGSAVVSMHVCHGTLRGLSLSLAAPLPQFAQAAVRLEVRLSDPGHQARYGIGLCTVDSASPTSHPTTRHWVWTDVPAGGFGQVQLAWSADLRGWQSVPLLSAETRFPLGLFRVWTVWRPAAQVLIYPAPEASPPPLPAGEPLADGAALPSPSPSGEFDGVRAYRAGDPLKSVVWKKSGKALAAGTGELVSRDAQQTQHLALWLSLDGAGTGGGVGAQGTEARLSRLCAWVLQAERLGLDYGLRLPSQQISPGTGEAHQRRCLEALALC